MVLCVAVARPQIPIEEMQEVEGIDIYLVLDMSGSMRAIDLAVENDIRSIAYPAISTGVYRFPIDRAAGIAVATVAEALSLAPTIERVIFACFGAESAETHRAALSAISLGRGE